MFRVFFNLDLKKNVFFFLFLLFPNNRKNDLLIL